MHEEPKYYLIEAKVMPAVLAKVVEVNRLVESGEAKNISQALKLADISRSAYYRYKDSIRPFYTVQSDLILTFYGELIHQKGVLSSLLNSLSAVGLNILTINQNIPVNGKACFTVSGQVSQEKDIDAILQAAAGCPGVLRFEPMAGN